MKRSPRRRALSVLVLFALLWMQLAVASYACPALAPAALATSTAATVMQDCDGMAGSPTLPDQDNPNLCLQHWLQSDQNSDSGHAASIPPAHDVVLAVVRHARAAPALTLRTALERDLSRTAPPPKSIVHCCYRI